MELTKIYEEGEKSIREKDFGILLDGVETEFVMGHNREVLDRYTFRQSCIDGVKPETDCTILGLRLQTPVIMSSMTMPIPAIAEEGLIKVAQGLKAAGSLMWTGTPIPQNLKELAATGVQLAANVKPYKDRKRMFDTLHEIQSSSVHWVGIEIDSGQGTKVRDRVMASDCFPLSLAELKEVRRTVSLPLIFKGILSRQDAIKSIEAGADGIMVSNHGAHTLDYLPHPFQVMDEIMEVARERAVVMVDGGFRRGSDVLKGLAFGASLVGLGRPILYGLAAGGREGVAAVIQQITGELIRIMSLVGAADVRDVSRHVLIEDQFFRMR
jgi:isopentenyl diphosphate isomerase/L-lactate dehydrogenase-like FMN-dependent dehydrogenase